MATWGWLLGYVALFAVLHLVLYYAYRRQVGEGDPSHPFAEGPGQARYSSPESFPSGHDEDAEGHRPGRANGGREDLDGEVLECPHCGSPNDPDPVYTYCWNCVSTLRR